MKKICTIILVSLLISNEIYSQNGRTAYPVPPGNGGTYRYRNDIKVDASNNVWVAFQDIGVGKFNGSTWTVYNNSNSSFPDTTAYAIAFDNLNNVWAGTNHGLAKFDGTSWSVFNTLNSSLPGDVVKSLKVNGNNLWIGTNFGAAVFDGTFWTVFNTSNSGIISDTINAFAFGTNGEAWIGTYYGLSKFYQNNWTNYDAGNSGLTAQNVLTVAVDNNNDVWMGSLAGVSSNYLFKMENGIIKNYITQVYNGTVPFNLFSSRALVKNAQGSIVTNNANGISEITPQTVNVYWFSRNLGGTGVFGVKNDLDASGKLWLLTNRCNPNNVLGGDSIFSFDFSQYNNYGYYLTNDNFKFLDINGVSAAMMDDGMMHWSIAEGIAKYEVPKGTGKNSVFASGLWIGGLDASNNLHTAAQTYRQTATVGCTAGGTDFWPGPIDTLSGVADSVSTKPYDKIWKVNRFDVEDFKYNFQLGNVTNGTYIVPADMLSWPASGIGNLTRNLAPYVDYNGDGVYNPFDGDYPKIKGDQMLWWVFNDNLSAHQETNADPLGFEIQTSAYAYTCPALPDSNFTMNWTTFYQYKIINRSSNNYNNLYIGLWSDMDLGFYQDDYVGCDSTLDAGFTYNGDAVDDLPDGYGANPPMQNLVVLKGPLADAGDGLDNNHNGAIDEPGERCSMNHFLYFNNNSDPVNGNPCGAVDHYNYLKSIWRNGTYVLDCNSNITNYMFNGEPYCGTGCTEPNFGNVPDDRRFIMSSGPFSLAAGQETTIDFAYVFTWDSLAPNGCSTSIARNISDIQRIKHWFDIDSFPSCLPLNVGTNQLENENVAFNIRPNPAHDKLFVQLSVPLKPGNESYYEIIDLVGKTITYKKMMSNFIDVKQLPVGLYILQFHNGENIYRKKFVKQ